jgi:5-methylcytosine-specific restriction endonuclease McrA
MSEANISFNYQDVLERIGQQPSCYLTGRPINLNEPDTYNFDHIVPASKGGDNSLDNLGLALKEANQGKSDMLLDDFLDLCEDVLRHHGRIS